MSLLEALIGSIAPPVCLGCGIEGKALCEGCAASEIQPHGERCWRCGGLSPACRTCVHCRWFGGPRYVWVTTDYAGLASQLVRAYKFGHQRFVAEAMAAPMADSFLAFNPDELMATANYLIVPVPTATGRARRRGFDHSALLARTLSQKLRLDYHSVVGRLGQKAQVGQRRAERLKQPAENYFVRSPRLVKGRNILLIDDVLTTGATLRAATKALRADGAKHVDALVFAKRL